MNLKSLLLISAFLGGSPAFSDSIRVTIVFGAFEFPIPGGDVKPYRNGRELSGITRTEMEDGSFEFDLDGCDDGTLFKVTLTGFYTVEDEFHPCEAPEMKVAAVMTSFQMASGTVPVTPSGAFTLDYTSVAYASWIQDVVEIDSPTLTAMGPEAIENQAKLIAAMSQYNFGEATFYANENAALARQGNFSSTAIGYAALTFDTGFRAMGIDPGKTAVPLVALDSNQNGIPVPTLEGIDVLKAYNTELVGFSDTDVWGFATSSALRASAQPITEPLIELETFDKFSGLELDVPSGMFVDR